ncbi:MAG: type II secretion system GspH family protein [Candidatus Pacebacteria bacterium]|nr:type II secretion system GspH family protein [Candidatus Paceibacterota bacterium]MCF7857493.1 type II secretion system GspH family protein [Candidatus Paceibacterota bacterium]
MNYSKLKNGFTLLELLVVITIISIVAVITVVYIGESKDKGADAGVKSNIINARSLAEVYYTNNNKTYEGVCGVVGADMIGHTIQKAKEAYGGNAKNSYTDSVASTWNTEECHDSPDGYAVWVPVRASTNANPRGFCIDGNNVTDIATSILNVNDTVCP